MGNCLFGGVGGEAAEMIQVITANGGVMEFQTPISAGTILEEFPRHAIFHSDDLFWKPLSTYEELNSGNSYYLLPLHNKSDSFDVKVGHVRSKSIPNASSAPYRMSFSSGNSSNQSNGVLKRSNTEVHSRCKNGGVWKVKLVIRPEQLVEILSQEAQTQELMESVRTVAKCGKTAVSSSSSSIAVFSDQWSVASSGNKDCPLQT